MILWRFCQCINNIFIKCHNCFFYCSSCTNNKQDILYIFKELFQLDSEISDDDTSQDANDLSEVESPPNKNKTEVKDNKHQQNRLEKEPTKEKPVETVKEVADKAEECKDKEDSDISNIVEPEANYMIGMCQKCWCF